MKKLIFIFFALHCHLALICQCDNTFQFPPSTFGVVCGLNTVTPFQYAGDFNVSNGYVDQSYLTFSSNQTTDFITLRKVTDNSLIAFGTTPLSIVYLASYGNIEMHINTNASCGTQNLNRSTFVQVACGCNNSTQWPASTFNIIEGTNTIATDQWAGDFNLSTGYQDEASCIFESSIVTDYITIRRASDNAILASGLTPVSLEYLSSMGNLEMHINSSNMCGTQNTNRTTTITHTKPMIYYGGANDGFALSSVTGVNPSDPISTIYFGGDNDGFAYSSVTGINPSDPISTIYFGGNNDGFSQASVTGVNPSDPISTIYFGGDNDGFAYSSVTGINPSDPISTIYFGGDNDGFASALKINVNPDCTDNVLRWSGDFSTLWENPANWDCGILPGIMDEVIIKGESLNMPQVNTNYEIKKLSMMLGSDIIFSNNINFKINGQ